ncbi:hypothetical protein D1781_09900 [Amnibacterium setariae]|uniref:TNase-like domain-containing protein n=1 Tax=Amnibacterium setariae TaxID=2306585 RepID=A0A3A1U1Y4_9MICO|nr:hypothetical protein D1781_09900 [Amnibacterium setariae]
MKFDGDRVDRFGRTLAAVFPDGEGNLSVALAEAGLGAPVDLGHQRFLAEVTQASGDAETKERGLFDSEIGCTAAGAVATAQARGQGLNAAGSRASMSQLVAAATSAAATDKLLRAADPRSRSLWRLYSRTQQARFADAFTEVRSRAAAIIAAPAARKQQIESQRKAAAEKAKQIRADRARKAAAAAKARKAAAARKTAAARRAARERADQAEQRGSSSSSGDLSGYTGCRRYAPGGRTWEPIPCH